MGYVQLNERIPLHPFRRIMKENMYVHSSVSYPASVILDPVDIYIVNRPGRPKGGDGSCIRPYNCPAVDDLSDLFLSDERIPPNSVCHIGPGMYKTRAVGGSPGGGGVNINKSATVLGAGQGNTIIQIVQDPLLVGYTKRCMSIGYGADKDNEFIVHIEGLTLDGNFANWDDPHDNTAHGGIRSHGRRTTLKNIDVINCGELNKRSESFHVFMDSTFIPGRIHTVDLEGIRFFDEVHNTPRKGDLGASAIAFGGSSTGSGALPGIVNAHVRGCSVHKSYRGVAFSTAECDYCLFHHNRVTGESPDTELDLYTCFLTDFFTSRNLHIKDNVFEPHPRGGTIIASSTTPGGSTLGCQIKDNDILGAFTRGGLGQVLMVLGIGDHVVSGNRIRGTATTDGFLITAANAGVGDITVSDNIIDTPPVSRIENIGFNAVKNQYNNFDQFGSPIPAV